MEKYFNTHTTIQSTALDGEGSADHQGDSSRPIIVEIVAGLKEDLYWGKLPEKVRTDALRKAGYIVDEPDGGHVGRKRRRKG